MMLREVVRASNPVPRHGITLPLLLLVLLTLAFDSRVLFAQDVVGLITQIGMRPRAVAVYEAGNKVFVADDATGNVYMYDGTTFVQQNSTSIGAFVDQMVVDEPTGKLFALRRGSPGRVAVLDATTGAFIQNLAGDYTLASLSGFDLALDSGLGKLYAISYEGLRQIDVATLVETTVPGFGGGGSETFAVNPVTHELFVSRASYKLTIVDGNTRGTLIETTDVGGYGVAVNWTDNKAYIAYCKTDPGTGYPQPCVYNRNTDTWTKLDTPGGQDALLVFYNPVSNRAYTSSEINAISTVIDGASDSHFDFPLRSGTTSVGVRFSTNHVYLVGQTYIGVLDDATGMLEQIPIPNTHSGVIIKDIAINQTTGRVFVINDTDGLNFVAVLQDTPRLTRPPIYIASENFPSTFHVFDPGTATVAETWNAPFAFQGANFLAMRTGGGVLYSAGSGSGNMAPQWFAGSGTKTNVAFLTSGFSAPAGLVGSPDGSSLYVADSGADSVAVIDEATRAVVANIPVGNLPWGVAITPDGTKLYVGNQGTGLTGDSISVISTATNLELTQIMLGPGADPWGLAVNPAGTKAYVANSGHGTVAVIDTATDMVLTTVTVGTTPHWLVVSPDGARVYVGNRGSSDVSVIDTSTETLSGTIAGVSNPEGIGVMPDNSYLYVVNYDESGSSSLTKIDTANFSASQIVLPSGGVNEPNSIKSIALAIGDNTSKFAGRITSGDTVFDGALVRALQGGVEIGAALSNRAGDYSVFNLLAGTYDLEISADGYATQTLSSLIAAPGRTDVHHVDLVVAPGSMPAMTSPTPGSTLTSSSETFTWTAGSGVTSYSIYVGSSVGGGDLYVGNFGTGLSGTISVLPTNGRTCYVRLYSLLGGVWHFTDYTYTAASVLRAAMISPVDGSILPSSTVTFTWSAASGASMYALYVGTTPGGSQIYASTQGKNLSRSVTGLPTNGSTVYVRLYSLVAGVWRYNDYTYFASGVSAAAMVTPAGGSTFSSSTVTFTWNAVNGASMYALYVGTTAGGTEIYANTQGTNLSRSVAGLPTNGGIVYVRLWSLLAGVWQYNDYTYAAMSVSKAAMAVPAGGSTLTSPTVTFTWSAANGASMYALYVGTTPGGTEIYANTEGTNLSRTVGGLPTNGSTVYVRLWSLLAGAWQFNDYTYTAASFGKAAMTGPSPGSTLTSSTVTFTWSAGAGAIGYSIYVGRSPGSGDVSIRSFGTNLSGTISGLPTDGSTLYVRLYSLTGGVWQFNDYTYTASGGLSPDEN